MTSLKRLALIAAFCASTMIVLSAQGSGTLATAGDVVTFSIVNVPSLAVQLSGTWGGTAVVEVTTDDGTWVATSAIQATVTDPAYGRALTQITTNGVYVVPNPGYTTARVRAIVWSGSAAVTGARGFAGAISPAVAPLKAILTQVAPGLPLPPCSALVRYNCQPKGF